MKSFFSWKYKRKKFFLFFLLEKSFQKDLFFFCWNCNLIWAFDKLNKGFTENDGEVKSYISFWPSLDFRRWQYCTAGDAWKAHINEFPDISSRKSASFLTLLRFKRPYLTCLAKLSLLRTANYHRISPFWWYRFQNSRTPRDIGLKFCMMKVLEKLEDLVHCFLPGRVHD
jgi:hypothetical protein